eukprot:CAMPEP_0206234506 /NCGR_PEP_ID=MMETSP0047_2-20121206/12630_1 /ASSEMBLY_ACC=CAM_ASM_000192 /TAXON_ID=195065 /ORGANISM="Chroomonas mesostigmatica_cf, Strain CCMP1168" /LENGTH=163 /DNA_ID=CAMNT_0053658603 /DNA_START=86 /DNA_END=577 /DNA_ORIENTATION=-
MTTSIDTHATHTETESAPAGRRALDSMIMSSAPQGQGLSNDSSIGFLSMEDLVLVDQPSPVQFKVAASPLLPWGKQKEMVKDHKHESAARGRSDLPGHMLRHTYNRRVNSPSMELDAEACAVVSSEFRQRRARAPLKAKKVYLHSPCPEPLFTDEELAVDVCA